VVTAAPLGLCIGTPINVSVSNSATDVIVIARVNSDGTIAYQDTPNGSNWITGVSVSSNVYSLSFASSLFPNSIECISNVNSTNEDLIPDENTAVSASGYQLSFLNTSGTAVGTNFTIACRGN
jgi:hypothetical protein